MKKYLAGIFNSFLTRFVCIALVAVLSLLGCASEPGGLTGNYAEDTQAVVQSLRYAVGLTASDSNRASAQADARDKINAFAALYRRDPDKLGLTSFTTLRTALNALASYYNGTTKRSVPVKVRDRVLVELDRVEAALSQGR